MIRKPFLWFALLVLLVASVAGYRIFVDDMSGLGTHSIFDVVWVNVTQDVCIDGGSCLSNLSVGTAENVWTTDNFTSTDVSNWNSAYGWGDHSLEGYVTEAGFTNGSSISVSALVLENPLFECNAENSFMTQYAGNYSTCRELNSTAINTSTLTNDAGFITATLNESEVEAMIFDADNTGTLVTTGDVYAAEFVVNGQGSITSNSTCLILSSPDGLTTLEVCN
jgi:hypothetical protein